MPRAPRSLLPAILCAVVALGVVACGSSSTSSASTHTTTAATSSAALVVGSSTVALTRETAEALKHDEITLTAIAPATASTTYVFPVSSGHVVAATLTGTVENTGGLLFAHAGRSARLTSFIVDTSSREITAMLIGVRRKIFEMNLSLLTKATGSNGRILGRDIELVLTSQAATTLNSALGVSTFKAGEHFGTMTLTLQVTH